MIPVDNNRDIEHIKKKEIEAGFRRFFRYDFVDCPAGKICQKQFGLQTSLSMIILREKFYDCYYFGAEAGNYMDELLTLSTQYSHIFSSFIFYFHEKCHCIIEALSVEKNRILLPQEKNGKSVELTEKACSLTDIDVENILKNITPTKFRLVVKNKEILLTLREAQCLSLWLRGNTLKKIANELALSSRTVQSHLDKIKQKLNCSSINEIVNILIGKFNDPQSRHNIISNLALIESVIWRVLA